LLVALPLAGCDKHDWDTSAPEPEAVSTFSFDATIYGLGLYDDGTVAISGRLEDMAAWSVEDGSLVYATAEGDFESAKLQDLYGQMGVFIDSADLSTVWGWTPGVVGYDQWIDEDGQAQAKLARLWDGGIVWIGRQGQGCAIFREGSEAVSFGCLSDLVAGAVDRQLGTFYLGQRDDKGKAQLLRIDDAGSEQWQGPTDLLAHDGQTQLLYAADDGAQTVVALAADGSQAWEAQLSGEVGHIAALGDKGKAGVLLTSSGSTWLAVLDGDTGQEQATIELPTASRQLASSADASTLLAGQGDRITALQVDWDLLLP